MECGSWDGIQPESLYVQNFANRGIESVSSDTWDDISNRFAGLLQETHVAFSFV